jgi:hypothetical protein
MCLRAGGGELWGGAGPEFFKGEGGGVVTEILAHLLEGVEQGHQQGRNIGERASQPGFGKLAVHQPQFSQCAPDDGSVSEAVAALQAAGHN